MFDLKRANGVFYTPRDLVQRVSRKALDAYLQVREARRLSVVDPACGDGAFLAGFVGEVRALGQDPGRVQVVGFDVDQEACDRARSRLRNLGIDARIECRDTLVTETSERFSIVLGNPPYVSALEFRRTRSKEARALLKSRYQTARGAYDLYVPFFEWGVEHLEENGVLAYVTPNKYLAAPYASALRAFLRERVELVEIEDVSAEEIFSTANVYPVITVLSNRREGRAVRVGSREFAQATLDTFADRVWSFLVRDDPVIGRFVEGAVPLGQVGRVVATTTAREAEDYGDQIVSGGSGFKVINTGTIDPYLSLWGAKALVKRGKRFVEPRIKARDVSATRSALFAKPKVIFAKLVRRCEAVLDLEGEYAALDVNCFVDSKPGVSLEYVAAFVHSSIFEHLYDQMFGTLRMGNRYVQMQAPQLRLVPIRVVSSEVQAPIERLVRELIDQRAKNWRDVQNEIDALFLEIYEEKK